jgi:hypothetical protein
MIALAEIGPAVARVGSLPAASCTDEGPAERVVLAIIATLAAVLVPGQAERLIDTPLTWANLACGLRHQLPRRARFEMTPG